MIEPFVKKLSKREQEVADLVCLGLSNKEVADKLFVIEKTIKFHLTNIFRKLRIRNRIQLIVLTAQASATSPEEILKLLNPKKVEIKKEEKAPESETVLPKGVE